MAAWCTIASSGEVGRPSVAECSVELIPGTSLPRFVGGLTEVESAV